MKHTIASPQQLLIVKQLIVNTFKSPKKLEYWRDTHQDVKLIAALKRTFQDGKHVGKIVRAEQRSDFGQNVSGKFPILDEF